jgi:hypothetical protein
LKEWPIEVKKWGLNLEVAECRVDVEVDREEMEIGEEKMQVTWIKGGCVSELFKIKEVLKQKYCVTVLISKQFSRQYVLAYQTL